MPLSSQKEIWQGVAGMAGPFGSTGCSRSYPVATDYPRDEVADEEIGWVQAFVLACARSAAR